MQKIAYGILSTPSTTKYALSNAKSAIIQPRAERISTSPRPNCCLLIPQTAMKAMNVNPKHTVPTVISFPAKTRYTGIKMYIIPTRYIGIVLSLRSW